MIIKDLGAVTAYAAAVEKGYTGTEEEFATLMASYASVAEEAAESAESAQASATTASSAASTATTKASEATTAAQTATAKAEEAQADADAAALDASQALSAASTATTKASEAAQSASDAVTAKTAAQSAQSIAEESATTAQTAAQTATQKAAEAAESARTLTIDTTLTQSGQAADAKKTGDEITDIQNLMFVEKVLDFTPNFLIETGAAVGTTINTTPVANNSLEYIINECKKGEIFTVSGTGGASGRLWCFTDSEYVKISSSLANATASNLEITAPADGYFICNVYKNSSPSVIKKEYTSMSEIAERVSDVEEHFSNITHITDPHKLFWKIGTFSQKGEQTGTFSDRMFTICKVKAGSRITAVSANGVKVSFGYKIDDSQTELDYYVTYNYQNIVVPYDSTIYIGCSYFPAAYLPNDSILDALTFDLYVIDYVSKYKKDRVFVESLLMHYEGQHTDATGWNLNTSDIDSIHSAFDALMTESNGLMTKKDLGVAYSTYHMYQYDTVPVGLHCGGGINLPKIAIICCEHGNEKMSVYSMHYLMHDIIHNAHKSLALMYLRSNCIISFIPIANPWGFINRSRLNENGVNLNRNFPTYHWDDYNDSTSGVGGINYKGTAPASEQQTKQIIDFLRNNYDAVFAIDLHTNGENTTAWYEISTAIINDNGDPSSDDYKIQSSYYIPSKVNTNMIKPWMDGEFGSDLGNVFYGNVTYPELDRPTAAQWTRESNNMVGITYEILAGSRDGYLGENLGNYSPDTIKAGAELLGDYIISMLLNCKSQ